MTLIITTISPTLITMVGDRRLSDSRGVVDDDAGKQGYWICSDAYMLYGYTGLARANDFDMPTFIADTLVSVAKECDYAFIPMLSHLAARLTKLLKEHPVLRRASDKRVSIIFAGFMVNGDPAAGIVSNFESLDDVPRNVASNDLKWSAGGGQKDKGLTASACFLTGDFYHVGGLGLSKLNELVLGGKSEKASMHKSVSLIEYTSEILGSHGGVGKKILAAKLFAPVDGRLPKVSTRYFTDEPTKSIAALDEVVTKSESECSTKNSVRITSQNGEFLRFPEQSKNSRCSCGSGKKYKHCHGRKTFK